MYNFNPDQNGRRVLTWVKRISLRLYLHNDNKSVLIDESDITNYKRKINDHALVCLSVSMTLVVETPKPLLRANYVIVLLRYGNRLAIKVTVVISSQTCVSRNDIGHTLTISS